MMMQLKMMIITVLTVINSFLFQIEAVTMSLVNNNNNTNYSVDIVSNYICDLAEGPFYDNKTNTLYHVDAFKGILYRLPLDGSASERHVLGSDLVSLVIPYADSSENFLITNGNRVDRYNWVTRNIETIAQLGAHNAGYERFNDGKADATGRLFVGSVVEARNGAKGIIKGQGCIYRLGGNQLIKVADNFTLSNGMDWSTDGQIFYFNDSEDQKIYAFDFDLDQGILSNKRVFINFKGHPDFKSTEYPDGLVVDRFDNIWVALFGGGRLVKINSVTGRVDSSIAVPASKVTSLTFGGPLSDIIYSTSAYSDNEPESGKIYSIASSDGKLLGKSTVHKVKST